MSRPKVGALAPTFALAADDGSLVDLEALRGKTVVLFFYPKDNTSGCTQEVCEFRDLIPRFKRGKAVVLGISPDSVRKHQNFKKKYKLNFPLLADVGHAVAVRYGLWVEKVFWGVRYMAVERTTYIIGPDGRIKQVFEMVNPEGHAEVVARAVRDLQAVARAGS